MFQSVPGVGYFSFPRKSSEILRILKLETTFCWSHKCAISIQLVLVSLIVSEIAMVRLEFELPYIYMH